MNYSYEQYQELFPESWQETFCDEFAMLIRPADRLGEFEWGRKIDAYPQYTPRIGGTILLVARLANHLPATQKPFTETLDILIAKSFT